MSVLLCFHDAFAAGPIDTDGPDFVDSSEVVGKNRFQFEADFVFDYDRRNVVHRKTFGTPTLFKYGISDTVELRLDTEGWSRSTTEAIGGSRVLSSGMGDTALSAKWHSQDRDSPRGIPAISWIFDAQMPSGGGPTQGTWRKAIASLRDHVGPPARLQSRAHAGVEV